MSNESTKHKTPTKKSNQIQPNAELEALLKMPKENTKAKTSTKKSNPFPNAEFEAIIKNQKHIVWRLKSELKSVIQNAQLLETETMEKDNIILELQQSINQRNAENNKLKINLEQSKVENVLYLRDFHAFKEKYFQLEIEYDKKYHEFEEQETKSATEIEHLTMKCQVLKKSVQDTEEALHNLDKLKLDFEQQHKEFELYKKQVVEQKKLDEENRKHVLETLTDEIKQKDETLKQCIADKNELEKEKNIVIDELNNKILRIERAFCQPTKFVQPMMSLIPENNANNSKNLNENVAINLPQVRNSLENLTPETLSNSENQSVEQNRSQRYTTFKRPIPPTSSAQKSNLPTNISSLILSNNENQNLEQNQNQSNYKFKRPLQPTTSSQQSNQKKNISPQRKRRNQPRQSKVKKTYNEFSSSSSEDESDILSNYSNFSMQLWRPNNGDCYVPDTDGSEGFAKNKRSKK